jgi:outer membrane lipoprotein-sorting protein
MTSRRTIPSRVLPGLLALVALTLRALDAASGAEPWHLSDLMALMAEVPSSRETFTEKKYMDVLVEPIVLTGDLSYQRPDRLERHVRQPYEERLIVEGDRLTLETLDGRRRIALRHHPVIWGFVESIRATLTGDEATLRKIYEAKLEGSRGQWRLTLRPKDPQLAEYVTSIEIDGAGNRIGRVETREADGDRSVMTIGERPS